MKIEDMTVVIVDGQLYYDEVGPGLSLPVNEIEVVQDDQENLYTKEDNQVEHILHPGR